jgi:two-component system chemotaxis response regulator CheY
MSARVLAVDDSASMRDIIVNILELEGYSVTAADNGMNAYTAAQQSDYDLVVTDYNMPGENGLDLVKALRRDPNYRLKPILVVTKNRDPAELKALKEAGATHALEKPFNPKEFKGAIKRLIG